jgi:hypothetical protein
MNQNQIIMTRQERKLLIKKSKRQTWLSVGFVGLFILNIVLLVTIEWRPAVINNPTIAEENVKTGDFIVVMFALILCWLPLFLAVTFNVRSQWTLRDLYDEKKRMYREQLRMYTEWLIQAVRDGNMERAVDLHDNFIWGSTKALTRGIILGYFYGKDIPEQREKVNKHFSNIPDEVLERD